MSCDSRVEASVHAFELAPERARYSDQVAAGEDLLSQFRSQYPFRTDMQSIRALTPARIYNPGSDEDYFFKWPEWRLRGLGGIFPRNDRAYVNARDDPETFKSLLVSAIFTPGMTIADRVDAEWKRISWFGGDRQIAKKIVSCYYPDECLPVFKTEDLEYFVERVGCWSREQWDNYWETCRDVGEKWERLGSRIIARLEAYQQTLGRHNAHMMYFLYHSFPPKGYNPRKLLGRPVKPKR